MKQIRITITCDEGFVKDSLLTLASYIDDSGPLMEVFDEEYETYHFAATLQED